MCKKSINICHFMNECILANRKCCHAYVGQTINLFPKIQLNGRPNRYTISLKFLLLFSSCEFS